MKRLTCLMLAVLLPTLATPAERGNGDVRVMTRNLYVGADIFRVVGITDPIAILMEIAAVYDTVVQTDFPSRAEALADEIASTNPHLVGLQEVSLIRTQTPGDTLFGNPAPAEDVEYDFLLLLLDALIARGLDYVAVASVVNADVELPLLGGPVALDVRLTDRDVILARADVPTINVLERNFDNFASLELSGTFIPFYRGYTAVDAVVNGRPYRFVNTHLETGGAFGAATQAAQAPELITEFADEHLPLIVVGDFNASPASAPELAYAQLTGAGYTDTWAQWAPLDDGFTCCHVETLDNPTPALTSRIDIVFARNSTTPAVNVLSSEVLGDEDGDQAPGGLWPSDHAGVFASLDFPVGDFDDDGIDDLADNCTRAANLAQRDTDNDGYGNLCDADFNQDGFVDLLDLVYMRQNFMTADPDADLDGDGIADLNDVGVLRTLFLLPPGPGPADYAGL